MEQKNIIVRFSRITMRGGSKIAITAEGRKIVVDITPEVEQQLVRLIAGGPFSNLETPATVTNSQS